MEIPTWMRLSSRSGCSSARLPAERFDYVILAKMAFESQDPAAHQHREHCGARTALQEAPLAPLAPYEMVCRETRDVADTWVEAVAKAWERLAPSIWPR
jgi:hypothetical protein